MLAKVKKKLKRLSSKDAKSGTLINASIYLLGNIAQKIVPFVLIPVYTRTMSQAEYGLLSLTLAMLVASTTLVGLGIDAAVTRLYYDEKDSKGLWRYLYSSFLLRIFSSFTTSAVFCLILFLGWGFLIKDDVSPLPYVLLIASASAFDVIIYFQQALLRAQRKPLAFVSVRLAQLVIQAGISLVLVVVFKWGTAGPLTGYLIGSALVAGFSTIRFFRSVPAGTGFCWDDVRRNLSYGLPTIPQKVGNWINNLSDRVILAKYVSLSDIGIYQLGYAGGQLISFIIVSINNAYVPHYYEMKGNGGDHNKTIIAMDSAIIALLGVLTVTGVLFAPEAIAIMAPPSFKVAAQIMPIIVISYYLNGVYTQFLKEFFHKKKTGLASAVVTIPALASIPLNLLAIPLYGIQGAAVVTFFSFLLKLIGVVVVGQTKVERTGHSQPVLWSYHLLVVAIGFLSAFGFISFGDEPQVSVLLRVLAVLVFALSSFVLLVLPHKNILLNVVRDEPKSIGTPGEGHV